MATLATLQPAATTVASAIPVIRPAVITPLTSGAMPGSPSVVNRTLPGGPALRAVLKVILPRQNTPSWSLPAARRDRGGYSAAFEKFLGSRQPNVRAAYRAHAQLHLGAPLQIRQAQFGRYSGIGPAEYASFSSAAVATRLGQLPELRQAAEELKIVPERLMWSQVKLYPDLGKPIPNPDLTEGLKYKKLQFFINSVTCLEETDEIGSDEINLGGTLTDSRGNVVQVGEFQVSDDFDQGETVALGRTFGTFDLDTDANWPHVYVVALATAEKDDGFAQVLQDLWGAVKGKVSAAIAAGLGTAIAVPSAGSSARPSGPSLAS